MKKLKMYAAMAATTLAMVGTAIPAQAAGGKLIQTEINGRTCYVYVVAGSNGCIPGLPDAPETPEEPGTPEIPDTPVLPDTPEEPEQPDTPEEDTSYAAQVVRLVNEERAKAGLSALTVDTGLEAASLVRAQEIVSNFSHTRPDGTSFSTAIREQNVSFRGAGENIAWGQKSPEAVMEAWMNSPGHRANILNENFTRIGVGHYQNGSGTNYWVQLFAY